MARLTGYKAELIVESPPENPQGYKSYKQVNFSPTLNWSQLVNDDMADVDKERVKEMLRKAQERVFEQFINHHYPTFERGHQFTSQTPDYLEGTVNSVETEPIIMAVVYTHYPDFEKAGKGAIFQTFRSEPRSVERHPCGIIMKCPGCGREGAMTTYFPGEAKPPSSASWLMEGFPDSITLTPSVNCVGCCGWHGWLKGGVYSKA